MIWMLPLLMLMLSLWYGRTEKIPKLILSVFEVFHAPLPALFLALSLKHWFDGKTLAIVGKCVPNENK